MKRYAEQGITTEAFDDLMRIFLAGWKGQEVKVRADNDCFKVYENSFNASYGWESVMITMFEEMSYCLENGSEFLIYTDNDYTIGVISDGRCMMIH